MALRYGETTEHSANPRVFPVWKPSNAALRTGIPARVCPIGAIRRMTVRRAVLANTRRLAHLWQEKGSKQF
ncbi:MAG: hypothetical protein ABI693_08105 [Bryobacteraceae bacterium]